MATAMILVIVMRKRKNKLKAKDKYLWLQTADKPTFTDLLSKVGLFFCCFISFFCISLRIAIQAVSFVDFLPLPHIDKG